MYQVPSRDIIRFGSYQNAECPSVVNTFCPGCGKQIPFSSLPWKDGGFAFNKVAPSKCLVCGQRVTFFWVATPEKNKGEKDWTRELFLHPVPKVTRQPLSGIESADGISDRLLEAYRAALGSFNACQPGAAAVLCGRVLEGILNKILPADKHGLTLASQLKELPQFVDLDKPILDLADGIRSGRNIAAHFDDAIDTTPETVEEMLDLLDYLIEYLFILPGRIQSLHDRITNKGRPDTSDKTDPNTASEM